MNALMGVINDDNTICENQYPHEGMKDSVKTIIAQCELWTDNNTATRVNGDGSN